MAQQCALVADFNVGVRPLPRATTIEKVAHVMLDPVGVSSSGVLFDDLAVLIDFPATIEGNQRRVGAIKDDAELVILEPSLVPRAMLPFDGRVGKVEGRELRVGRFLVVVEMVLASSGRHVLWRFDAQSPASNIQPVDAVITALAGAVEPAPVPMVRDEIFLIERIDRRSGPEIEVE